MAISFLSNSYGWWPGSHPADRRILPDFQFRRIHRLHCILPVLPDPCVDTEGKEELADDYSDLPVFLSEIAMLRLQRRAGMRTLASVNPYQIHSIATSAFGRMHFSNGFNEFVGREEELKRLNVFLESGKKISWYTVLGDGGIGKSRLVLEWLRSMPTQWFGYFTYKKPEEARKFVPFTHTVIVFDYVLGKEKECAETIEAYHAAFEVSPYKLRFLFIERNQATDDADWLIKICRALEGENRVVFESGNPCVLG